ncbi:hypothetical protein GCM10007242_45850 [Pigmentiphaga litoralis]|nr:hypothetical protein GCM10007242_45850 [Pigmentiphaga litoralis]
MGVSKLTGMNSEAISRATHMAMAPTAAHGVRVAEDEDAGRDDAVDEADAAAAGLAVEEVMGTRGKKG